MSSLVLRTAARFLIPLLVLFSIYTLFRGHHLPGGGFAGGLLASTAFALHVFAWGSKEARRAVGTDPHVFLGAGLLLALGSGLLGMLSGKPLLTGLWADLPVPEASGLALGTPVVFDIGVYLVVLGASLLIIGSLTADEEEEA